jgi:primary-amine oxidase
MLCSTAILALGLIGGSAKAQGERVSDPMIETALNELRLSFTHDKEGFKLKMSDRPVLIQNLGGKMVLAKATMPGLQTSLAKINRYNDELAVTTRGVRYQGDLVGLEAGLDCRAGTTAAALKTFIGSFANDIREFEKFLAKAKPTAEDKQPANAGDKPPVIDKQPIIAKPQKIPMTVKPQSDDKDIEMHFPTNGASETAWKIVWDMESGEQAIKQGFNALSDKNKDLRTMRGGKWPLLFKIKKAYYRPGPDAPWVQVLEDAHPSEFYVPYFFHNTRFFDLGEVGSYSRLSSREGGARSQLLSKDQNVMAELRDRGIVYKHGDLFRRGEELVLWANFAAGNYTYMVEFCFHDDGTIVLKHAPTGYNYFSHFDSGSHMHNCLWRIGMKLTPIDKTKANNQAYLVSLPYEPAKLGSEGKLDVKPILNESFHDWQAKEFTRVRVTNPDYTVFPADAAQRLPVSYDLVPVTQGSARHYRFPNESFTHHDFWVTRSDCPEKMYVNLGKLFEKNQGTSLKGSDGLVLWHMSSALHVPRGEDGIFQGNSRKNGQALVYWTLVELRPRNLFTRTPLYPRDQKAGGEKASRPDFED